MKTVAVWLDDETPPCPPRPPLPERVDVAVVGAGYTGLSAALSLVRSGATVVVFERGRIGAGASSVNGGQLCPGLKPSGPVLFERYGEALGRELWAASVEAVHYVEELIRDEGIDCGYEPTGGLSLAFRPSHYERQARSAEWLRRNLGYERQLIPREEMRKEIGSDVFFGGLLDPRGGGVHPARLARGLARAAAGAGAVISEDTEVTGIDRRPEGGFTVRAGSREIRAREVLVATNGYTGDLVLGLAARVIPIGSYIIATEPLPPELQREVSPNGRMFFDTRWFLNYFRLTPDGRVAFGGRNNLSTDLPLEESAVNLRSSLLRVFPQLAGFEVTHSWTGRLGFTFDLLPHIGRIDGIHYALGFSGHGVALASYLGREAARTLAGNAERGPFSRIPHEEHFYYRGTPWFLPLAAAFYRLRDRWS
jgi:glycine/D-amino acid oxidase-like deaminating enzyme